MCFIRDKVDVANFIVPFKGKFGGKCYDPLFPPRMEFPNYPICMQFEDFISSAILDRFKNGSLVFWGKVGEVQLPHLVMPITVEPSKPRMCHDERFLNLWIKDCPFSLDYLSDLPRYIGPGHYQTVCDDKSGYDRICLSPSSRTFFRLSWRGCYFVYNTLPFRWKVSAYVFHTTGLLATSYISTLCVPYSQYIDNRHAGQLVVSKKPNLPEWSNFEFCCFSPHFLPCQSRLSSLPSVSVFWVTFRTPIYWPLSFRKTRSSSLRPYENPFCVKKLWILKLCSVLQAKPPRSLLQFPQLGFTLVPRFVLFRPILDHPTSSLRSQATYRKKSDIGDFCITSKAVFPGLMRGI